MVLVTRDLEETARRWVHDARPHDEVLRGRQLDAVGVESGSDGDAEEDHERGHSGDNPVPQRTTRCRSTTIQLGRAGKRHPGHARPGALGGATSRPVIEQTVIGGTSCRIAQRRPGLVDLSTPSFGVDALTVRAGSDASRVPPQ